MSPKNHMRIEFDKKDILKITGSDSLETNNVNYAYFYILFLYEQKNMSSDNIAAHFNVDDNLIKRNEIK